MSDLFVPGTNSQVKKIPFSAKKRDGFNPSVCICDEVASWEGDAGLKQYEVMKSGMGARPEGILLSTTTSGYVNDSIYDELLLMSENDDFLKVLFYRIRRKFLTYRNPLSSKLLLEKYTMLNL
jgi:hypothetical protein